VTPNAVQYSAFAPVSIAVLISSQIRTTREVC
jgi:hypothetical protein